MEVMMRTLIVFSIRMLWLLTLAGGAYASCEDYQPPHPVRVCPPTVAVDHCHCRGAQIKTTRRALGCRDIADFDNPVFPCCMYISEDVHGVFETASGGFYRVYLFPVAHRPPPTRSA
jgi:hypothetical protein